jgi:hypothetical protein
MNSVPGVPPSPAGKPASRKVTRLERTIRTRWWPRFLLTGVLLTVVGATLLSGMAQAVVVGLGALIIFVLFIRATSTHDYSREPPTPPPGAPGPGF